MLQNVSYTYDGVGNISQVQDSASSSARKTVNYGYDNLYRLLTASTTAVATSTASYAQAFSYDALGNMQSGPSGTYTYAGTGYANPDAATAIGGVSYSYDQAGNLLSYGSTTLTWDYHNYMTQTVVGGGGSVTATATPLYVQSGLSSTTSSVTLGSTVTTGNLIIVGLTAYNTSLPSGAITDNKGNSYTRIGEVINATTDHLALYYAANVTGGSSFTVTSTAGGTLSVHEYSGIATSSPFDKTASSTGASGTLLSSGNITPSVTGELLFGLGWSELHGSSWSAGYGYTLRTQETNNNTAERSAGEDRVATTTTATSSTFVTGGSAAWSAMIASFKPKVTVTSGGGSTTLSYKYDENGKRVQLIDPTSTTTSYWGSTYQATPSAYKKTKNIFVNGALLATMEKTGSATMTPYYVLTDPLNSASILMNSSGVATQTLDYLPYGDVRVNAKQTSYDSGRKYLGKINDTATNLDYLEARYYQSPVGRFISQDPMQWGVPDAIGNPQALNYYSYANGNPIMLSDPSGLRAFTASEIAYNQATFAQISQLTAMGKLDVANQMYTNLQAYMREVAGIPTGGGGNFVGGGGGGGSTVTQTPAVTRSQGGGNVTQSGGGYFIPTPSVANYSGGGYTQSTVSVNNYESGGSGGGNLVLPSVGFIGAIWQNGNNGGQLIDGVYYVDHALDRMAPKGLWLEGNKLGSRGIPPAVVKNAITNGAKSAGQFGRTIFTYENVKVVVGSAREAAKLGVEAVVVVSAMILGT